MAFGLISLKILRRHVIIPVAIEKHDEATSLPEGFANVDRAVSFLEGGSAASQYIQQTCSHSCRVLLCLYKIRLCLFSPLCPWLNHPWLPQDDRLSYRESLSDSGVSRTWGRLGDSASSGRSLKSSSPDSRLISGTLGARVFPLRLIPDWVGTGRLPGSTIRLEEGPLAFMLWNKAQQQNNLVICSLYVTPLNKETKSGLEKSSNCESLIFSWLIISKGRRQLYIFILCKTWVQI